MGSETWVVRLVLLAALSLNYGRSGEVANLKSQTVTVRGIHKRGLFYPVLLYPYNACSGILAAIAIPLNVPNRNVFLSYNFEANYNMPNQASDSVPGMINRFPGLNEDTRIDPLDVSPDDVVLRRSFEKSANNTNSTSTQEFYKKAVNDVIVFTRTGIYRVLESRLNA